MSRYKLFFRENRIDFIRGLSGMEGELPSKVQTQVILDNLSQKSPVSLDELVLLNILRAWSKLFNTPLKEDPHFILTLYKELQYLLSQGVEDFPQELLYRGRFRDKDVAIQVGSYVPPSFSTSLEAEQVFLQRYDKVAPTVEGILAFYLDLMRYQFFANTNKRTAYLLTNYLFMVFDLPYMLTLPVSREGNRQFLRKLGFFYLHPRQRTRMITYLKKYYLKRI